MAVFIDIHDDRSLPAKEKVAGSSSQDDGQTQPDVVGHEDQHQTVADKHLNNMEDCLCQMRAADHRHPETCQHTAVNQHMQRTSSTNNKKVIMKT